MLNGTMYGEGSAMVTSSHCEYCYCIKGKQHCVRPHCLLKVPGCTPEYSQHSCCPTKYNCSNLKNATITSTTTASSMIQDSGGQCNVKGSIYPEGEKVDGAGDQCHNCYCMKGTVRCEATICPIKLDTCRPVTSPGHCCPTSYNCSDSELTTELSTKAEDESTTEGSITFDTTVVDSDMAGTTVEGTTETSTIDSLTNDTELRSGTESGIYSEDTTTIPQVTLESTTITEPSIIAENNSSNPVRSIPDVLEALINRTLAKDEDYEYDYNEPSLPPSLPNLKIIPFVAADAVLEENEYGSRIEGKTEIPIYLDIPQPNRFSPPSKTEGGFVPRDPVIDGPFYESNFEKPFTKTSTNEPQVELTSETALPPITELPKLFEEGKCESEGRTYHHGEVVSEPNACELCVCYYKEIHCQQPKCSPLKPSCHRVHDENSSCCGREICDDKFVMLSDNVEDSTSLPESMSNIPAITVAELIVTPDPFKDVIRTEPAPDLIDIMKDMLPHLANDTSSTMDNFTHTTNDTIKYLHNTDYSPGSNISLEKPTNLLEINVTSTSVDKKEEDSSMDRNNTKMTNSTKFHEDYEDSFSFGSVLDILFQREHQDSSSKYFISSSTTMATKTSSNMYHIHSDKQKQEINNAIEHLDHDYSGQKDKEKTDLFIFNDYQADESRNNTKGHIVSLESIDSEKKVNNETPQGQKIINDDNSGLVKLAGCNIYGRMYRVGGIISELSSSCLECMCTEFGVQCRKLSS